jgi:hypothetical protein
MAGVAREDRGGMTDLYERITTKFTLAVVESKTLL